MKNTVLFFVYFASIAIIKPCFGQTPVNIGNTIVDGTIDIWNSTLVVDEIQTYTNGTLVNQVVAINNFNFFVELITEKNDK